MQRRWIGSFDCRISLLIPLGFLISSFWLSDMDSNHDYRLQRPVCYHYTIGHARRNLVAPARSAKVFFGRWRRIQRWPSIESAVGCLRRRAPTVGCGAFG
jgi:hypothetical protein